MQSLKDNYIGIYEKAIPNHFNWSKKIDIAKESGYQFIEMSIDESDRRLKRLDWSIPEREKFKKLIDRKSFEIRSICLSAHRRFPFGSNHKDKRKKAYKIIKKAIRLAKDLGIKNIQLAGYDNYYEESSLETKRNFIKGLKYSAKLAEKENIMLSIEIMDTEFIGTIDKAIEYIELVDSPYLKIYPDIGNLTQWTDSISEQLKKGRKHMVGVHIKDTKPGVFKNVPFGKGTVDFVNAFKILKEINYNGPLLVEMWANNDLIISKKEAIDEITNAKKWIFDKIKDKSC